MSSPMPLPRPPPWPESSMERARPCNGTVTRKQTNRSRHCRDLTCTPACDKTVEGLSAGHLVTSSKLNNRLAWDLVEGGRGEWHAPCWGYSVPAQLTCRAPIAVSGVSVAVGKATNSQASEPTCLLWKQMDDPKPRAHTFVVAPSTIIVGTNVDTHMLKSNRNSVDCTRFHA